MCPLLFKNASIKRIDIWGMRDYFYNTNVLSFTNDKIVTLNSDVKELKFYHCENFVLDSKLVNPSVFKNLQIIVIHEFLRQIGNELFGHLEKLTSFEIKASYFRRLVHQQGLEWIKSRNRGLKVNLSDPSELKTHKNRILLVSIKFFWGYFLQNVFPDTDFCLYKDFPSDQLVVLIHNINNLEATMHKFKIIKPTCTFRWITRYYKNLKPFLDRDGQFWTEIILRAESNISTSCDFQKLFDNCYKNKFHSNFILDMRSTKLFTTYLEVFFASSSLVISLFGVITNSALVLIILSKKNLDLFKNLKQYPYLCALSVINLITLIIQLLSWLSECKNTYKVFCPDTSRLVFFQFFKIIFKETLIVCLRFMSNFAYMGFAFNRIALIGQNHPKIVEKLTKWQFKNFMIATGVISMIFSIVKGFKYQVKNDFFFVIKLFALFFKL